MSKVSFVLEGNALLPIADTDLGITASSIADPSKAPSLIAFIPSVKTTFFNLGQ